MTLPFRILAEENDVYVYLNVTNILLKILDNILKAPENSKYRKLRLENEIVANAILPAEGALQCLSYLGFKMNDGAFIMPSDVPISRIQEARNELIQHKKTFLTNFSSSVSTSRQVEGQSSFFEQIRSYSKHVLLYENQESQNLAKNEIPLDELYRRMKQKQKNTMGDFEVEFGLLYELMMWFKTEFFTWMDNPRCQKCTDSSVVFKGLSSHPTDFIDTDRVELYECERCHGPLIFPRYNNPVVLLKTRTGRCGEWANCFTLMCRSLGYDARYVVDKTDHVWTEVYSQSQRRWIHCDPCEGQLDTPLVYELGWKKNLTYVLAFSKDEIQDVTWRYTTLFIDVLARRKECSEEALLDLLLNASKDLQASLPFEQKRILEERRVRECVEFLTPPHSDKQYCGRSSGSLLWRLNREECSLLNKQHVWQPNEIELERKRFRLQYSSAKDEYYRTETDEIISGWNEGIYESTNIFRKVEYDWKQCYLCRTDDLSAGTVIWKFSSKQSDVVIDKVKIKYQLTVFYKGTVKFILCNNDTCVSLDLNGNAVETDEFCGSNELSLMGLMDAEDRSPGSWQHAQIFRQSIDDDDFPFEIDITFSSNPNSQSYPAKTDFQTINSMGV